MKKRHVNLLENILELCKYIEEIRENLADERRKLNETEYKNNNDSFSAFLEIELFSESINGVAYSIVNSRMRRNPTEDIKTLKNLDIYLLDEFRSWFFNAFYEYPKTCNYVLFMDLLRNCLIEYLQSNEQE